MATVRIALLLVRAWLNDLPGAQTPLLAAALLCAVPAVLISIPAIWLMNLHLLWIIPGMIIIGLAAQATLICPYFLLPERCNGGLQGALSGILSITLLGASLPLTLSGLPFSF